MDTDRHGKVQMKAKDGAFGTTNSPTTGQVLHVDARSKADVDARYPYVSPDDAEHLKRLGLADEYDGKVPDGDGGQEDLADYAARNLEDHNDAEGSVDATTGLSTRATTAFPEGQGGLTGVTGPAVNLGGTDEAPAGSGKSNGSEPKPLNRQNIAELDKTAADLGIAGTDEYKAAETKADRQEVIQKAIDAKQA